MSTRKAQAAGQYYARKRNRSAREYGDARPSLTTAQAGRMAAKEKPDAASMEGSTS
jgi:hypothetical protein